jgi:hypothetical protein
LANILGGLRKNRDKLRADRYPDGNDQLTRLGRPLNPCFAHRPAHLSAMDTTPNYIDTEPLPATAAKWTYRGMYYVGDAPVGQWSDPVNGNNLQAN